MGRLQTDCNGRGREGAPPEGAEEVEEEAASERQSGAEECSLHSATATNIATCLPLRATALPRLLPGSAAENSKQAGKMRCLPSSTSVLVK